MKNPKNKILFCPKECCSALKMRRSENALPEKEKVQKPAWLLDFLEGYYEKDAQVSS